MSAVDQHATGLTHGARAEACPAPIGRTEVERNAGYADLGGGVAPG